MFKILVGDQILKNFGVELEPILIKNGLFVLCCLTLYTLPARRSLLTSLALA
jgi:hypothetical protein